MIEFEFPWLLALLPLPLLVWHLLPPWPAQAWLPVSGWTSQVLGGVTVQPKLLASSQPRALMATVIGWVAIVAALAGPRSEAGEALTPSGRDLVLAIDLSASMGQEDIGGEGEALRRIDVVGELAGEFVNARLGDRLALIGFAQAAYLIAPLTFDSAAIAAYLEELAIGLPGRRTDLATAIGLITKTLAGQPADARVAVILSDGESNSGDLAPNTAAALAKEHGIKLHTIGFSPNGAGGHLSAIATITGGQHFSAHSTEALAEVYRELDRIEPVSDTNMQRLIYRDWREAFLWLALLALAWRFFEAWRQW